MKRKDLLLTVLAAVLALTAAIGAAHAYFTTYITARGGYHLLLGKEIVFSETPTSADKTVTIQSDANSGPLYVRVKAIVAAQYADKLAYSGDNWILEDGYYYYTPVLEPGQTADALYLGVRDVLSSALDEEQTEINIIVVYECAPVLFDEDGSPYDYNDPLIWAQTLLEGGAA